MSIPTRDELIERANAWLANRAEPWPPTPMGSLEREKEPHRRQDTP